VKLIGKRILEEDFFVGEDLDSRPKEKGHKPLREYRK